jgi:hypothetical protein
MYGCVLRFSLHIQYNLFNLNADTFEELSRSVAIILKQIQGCPII